jgi:hypothetical protein
MANGRGHIVDQGLDCLRDNSREMATAGFSQIGFDAAEIDEAFL